MVTDLPNQRASVAEKQKDSWYVNNIHYWIDLALVSNIKIDTARHIDAANGVIDEETYAYALNPLSAYEDKTKNLPGVIREVDFITPIREKNIGEYLELPHESLVKVDDPDISLRRNQYVAQEVRPMIEEYMVNLMQQGEQGGQMPQQEQIQQGIQKLISNWIDDKAIEAQHLLNWMKDNNKYDDKRLEAFSNWWATEECYMHAWIQGGDVHYEVINPLEGYPIENGYEYVDDNDAFVIRRRLSINRIMEYYGDRLTDKDYKYLEDITRAHKGNGYYVDVAVVEDTYGRRVFSTDGNKLERGNRVFFSDFNEIWEYLVYFKTQTKIRILHRVNELGETVTQVVESNYKLNPLVGDITIESQWVDEVWSQVLLGEQFSGIYLKPEAIPVQAYDSKGHVRLPVTGKKGLLNGTYINPIPKRIAPNQALFRVITLQIERQMAKYKGAVEIIPQSMLLAGENADPKAAYFYRMADNTIVYDDSAVDMQTVSQGYKIVGNDSVSAYIRTLIDLREVIKSEAWEMANMNDSRFGEAAPSSTVTNNQQNIFRAKLGSVLMVTTFNRVMLRLHEIALEYAKVAYSGGVGGGYFGRDGGVHHFNIDSHALTNNNYGLFMTNSVVEKSKLDEYRKLAFSAAQNGDFGLASKALESDSVSEISKHVEQFISERKEFEQSMQQQEMDAKNQAMQQQKAMAEDQQAHEIEKINVEQDHITEREIEKANIVANSKSNISNK